MNQITNIGCLITNGGGTHPPEQWAEVVASGLVMIDPRMPTDRLQVAVQVRARLKSALTEAFHAVKRDSSDSDLGTIARGVRSRMEDIFAGTPWQASIEHPEIATQLELHVFRNLRSAADLALATE